MNAQAWNTIIILWLIAAVVIFIAVLAVQASLKKAVKGHIYCEFRSKAHASDTLLLIDKGGKVTAPDKYKDVPGGEYFFDDKHVYLSLYPPSTFKFLQVPVIKAYFSESNPNAQDPFNTVPVLDAQTLEAALNQKFTQLMLNAANEVYDKLEAMLKVFKLNPTTLYLVIGAVGLMAAVSLYFGYMNYRSLATIMRAMPR